MIDYQEHKTLERVLAHHGLANRPELTEPLARLIEWAHQDEAAKHGGEQPVFLLCLEGMLGLHRPQRGQERVTAA